MGRGGKTISVRSETYDRLKAFCEVNGISISQLVETRVNAFLDAQPENLLDEPIQVAEHSKELP